MNDAPLLSVNVDHVATLRQARRASYPDPVAAAELAESAGAGGITVHLRADRRHIQDDDVRRLSRTVRGKLNLEISTAREMLQIALEVKPHQVTLVPERPDEVTTEGGLDLTSPSDRIQRAAATLARAGIDVSLFIDPDLAQIEKLAETEGVTGFELNTDRYTSVSDDERPAELEELRSAAERGRAVGLRLFAGHGLTTDNVGPVAAIEGMEELNIGHFLVSRSVLVGMEAAVKEMLAAIGAGAG